MAAPGARRPLRPFGVGETLDEAVRLVKRNARAAFTISAPFALVTTVLTALVQLATYGSSNASNLQVLTSLFVTGLFGTVLSGLLAPVFAGDLFGRRVGAGEAMARVGGSVAALLALAIVVAVAEEAGVLLLVVGGVWLWGVWAVAAPALVVERTGAFAALGRSFALVRNSFWRTWGVRALGWVVTTVLGLFVTVPFLALAGVLTDHNPFDPARGVHQPGLYVTVIAIGRVLSATLVAPITAAIETLLYVDLRMRREGMDLVLGLDPQPGMTSGHALATPVTAW